MNREEILNAIRGLAMKTNGDVIREMNNEELASWIYEIIEDVEWDEYGNNNYEDDWEKWLNEPIDWSVEE
jgi:hypothetical protein